MSKKILTAIITAALIFSPIGNIVFHDHSTTVEAKKYGSGRKSFNPGSSTQKNNITNFQTKKKFSTNKSTAFPTKKSRSFSGGLMRGLMFGGLAGLLFGGLLGNLGMMGSLLGLIVNVIAIMFVISIIRRIFNIYKTNKKKEDHNSWRR